MKLNKFMIVGIILLTILSLSVVNATDNNDNLTAEIQQDTVELSEINENNSISNEPLSVSEDNGLSDSNEEIVTPQNVLNYFDDEGTLLESVTSNSLKFKGDFSNTFKYITLPRSINVTGENATFNNVGFKISGDSVVLSNLKFVASNSYSDGLIQISGASNVVVSGLDINYCVGDVDAIAINLDSSSNTNVIKNKIHFESQVTSEEIFALAINFDNCHDVIADYNEISCFLPALSAVYDESRTFMGLNNVNPIRIKDTDNLKLRYNKISSNTNKIISDYPTIQSILLVDSKNILFDYNNISMVDNLTPDGNASFLYGISFAATENVTISNCDFYMSTTGGKESLGTAYALQGIKSDIKIIGNKIHCVSKGPMIGIYIPSLGGESSEIEIKNNFINVTGYASAVDNWALVTGIEIQNGDAKITNNTIYTYSISPYNDNNYHFGISYAQWMYGNRSFTIINNHIYSGGKYTISTIATKEDEHTNLIATGNYLIAHDLKGDASIYSVGATLSNNKPTSSGDNSSDGNYTEHEDNSSGENPVEIDTFKINVDNVWVGNNNVVTVNITNATGQVTIKINGNTYDVGLIDGIATKTLLASELNPGVNNIMVSYGGMVKNTTFHVLNGVVTKDNILDYFDQSNNGKLYDYVPTGVTLDFQGEFKASEIDIVNIYINKAVNIISSTKDAIIDLNTTAGSLEGESPGNRFTIDKSGSNTNVTGITFHNTQLWLTNTDHVVLDNISVIVEDQRVGSGVGATSIRENSSYVTVKNSYFYTRNNGGSSSLVIAWANYCTFENNEVIGEGEVGNIIYITTYNVNIPEGAEANSYNKIINNFLRANPVTLPICYGIAFSGNYNLIENNTVIYSGMGITSQNGLTEASGNIFRNNNLSGGASMIVLPSSEVYSNHVSGTLTLPNEVVAYNNTVNGLIINGNEVVAYNNTINGEIKIGSFANIQINDSVINGDISFSKSTNNVILYNNDIKGTITLQASDNKVINNNISSDNEYAIIATHNTLSRNNYIAYNVIYASEKYGDEAVNTNKHNTVENNRPISGLLAAGIDSVKVGEDVTVKIFVKTDATGVVKLKFNGTESIVNINNGEGTRILSNLPAGSYSVDVSIYDDQYGNVTITKSFTVSRYSLSIDNAVTVEVIDNVAHVYFNSTDDVTGNLIVRVLGGFSKSISEGKSTIVLSGLNPGAYRNINVLYSGNEKYDSASTKITFIIRADSNLAVEVEDILVGENANIEVSMYNGFNGNVTLVFNGEHDINVVNGKGNISIPNLAFGNYTINVKFNGDEESLPAEITKTFKVSKNNVSLDNIIMYCDGRSVEFSINLTDATGDLTVQIGENKYINSTKNGVKPQLVPDTYSATVSYSGDGKYNPVSKTFEFIIKNEATLNAEVSNISVGENATVTISINKEISEGVVVFLNDQYSVKLIEGKGNVSIPNLGCGNYTIKVQFGGNDYFFEKELKINLSVFKVKLSEDIITVDGPNYSIDIANDAKGNLTVVAGNNSYSKPIVSGKATINIDDLTPGDYDVVISYSGDDKYEGISKKTTLNVPKYESTVFVNVNNISVGEVAVFNVQVPNGATGNVSIIINDKKYNGTIKENIASVNVSGLAYGNYSVVVQYLGDNHYLPGQNNINLTVSKVVISQDCIVNEENRIVINLPEDITGELIITNNGVNSTLSMDNGYAVYSLIDPGQYNVTVSYDGDLKYDKFSKYFKITIDKLPSFVLVNVTEIYVGDTAIFNITVPDDASGLVSVIIGLNSYNKTIEGNKLTILVSDLASGNYDVSVKYYGDKNYYGNENRTSLNVLKITLKDAENVIVIPESDSPTPTYSINLEGATGNLTVIVDGEVYSCVDLVNGSASIDVKDLPSGSHSVEVIYSGDSRYAPISRNVTVNVAEPVIPHVPVVKVVGSDVFMLYTSGAKYKVRVTSDGKPVSGKTVNFVVNGVKLTAKTDKDGYASVKIDLPPKSGKYTVTATYNGVKATNNVKVNGIVSAKNVKVKKSAKQLKIKVTLKKVNGKYIKSKKVILKFKGKKYTAKTNKKGVATFKIPKKVIKKLKKGKKYTYKATYLKQTVSKKVTVKK